MARYIDANKLKLDWLFSGKDGKPYRDTIDEQPTADVKSMDEIKALGKELRTVRKGIKDKNTLIGFNLAVAICNKHLGWKNERIH